MGADWSWKRWLLVGSAALGVAVVGGLLSVLGGAVAGNYVVGHAQRGPGLPRPPEPPDAPAPDDPPDLLPDGGQVTIWSVEDGGALYVHLLDDGGTVEVWGSPPGEEPQGR